jgi:DNA-binding transcriptional MerR regulator
MQISEASERTGLSKDTLRYYERIGLLSDIPRKNGRIRDYQEEDIARIDFVKCMRNAGLPIEVLIEYIALVEMGDETVEDRRAILHEQREILADKLQELQSTLDLLDYKIQIYDNAVLKREKELLPSNN